MGEKLEDSERPQSIEQEKFSDSIITVFAFRHGESDGSKLNVKRGITEKGKKQVIEATKKIIREVSAETDPKTNIEFRLYDSGVERTRESLEEAVKVLAEKGYETHIYIIGIKKRIRPIIFPKEARVILDKEADELNQDLLTHILSEDEPRLEKIGMETPKQASERFQSGIESACRIAQGLRNKNYPKKIVAIVFSHDIPMGSYLREKLGIDPQELGKIDNAQGLKIDFTGIKDTKPMIKLWGKDMENKQIDTD